jgi:hypothetical protein
LCGIGFFARGGHDQIISALTGLTQQKRRSVLLPVLLDTFVTFLVLYQPNDKKKPALIEFMIGQRCGTR